MHYLVVWSAIIAVTGMLFYIVSILKRHTKPHRVTRLVATVILGLGTIGLYSAGDFSTFYVYCIYTSFSFAIFLLTLWHGVGGWTKTDIICLCVALCGIIVWQVSSHAIIAVFASIIASFIGTVPAFIKTYESPKTEYWVYYFCNIPSNLLIFFAHDTYTFSNSVFPLYYVAWNVLFLYFIFHKKIRIFFVRNLQSGL